MIVPLAAAGLALLPYLGEQQEQAKEAARKKAPERFFRFQFTSKFKRPSIRLGDVLRVDFRVKQQFDFRLYEPVDRNDELLFDYHRRRVGVEGLFLRHFEFEVERELEIRKEPLDTDTLWRDVFVNFARFRLLQVQAGRFKVPFGMDQLTGPMNLDFVYRSRIGDQIAPGRSTGLMVHGRLLPRLRYQIGLFRHDGDNARFDDQTPDGEIEKNSGLRTVAGRLTAAPLRLLGRPKIFEELEVGVAVASSTVPESQSSLRLRSFGRETLMDRFFVKGERRRTGLEFSWMPGPFSLKSEYARVNEQRLTQSLLGLDLSDYIMRAWYVSGTWCITGEPKAPGVEPRREFVTGRGIGAVELGARFEVMRFASDEQTATPSRSIRAANIRQNSDRAWTFGVTWYVNRWVKIQYNGIREKFEDVLARTNPISGRAVYWMQVVRIQGIL
ncbi:MAG: OprO/OprP family phosphate-selective porin [Bryobacteraceae bacterium]